MDHKQEKVKKLWKQNQKFDGYKNKYKAFFALYKRDSDNNIDNINKKTNYLEDNDKNSTKYIMAAHFSKKSFMHFLIA